MNDIAAIADAPSAPAASHASRSGAQILHDLLIEQGVEVIFGYPGAAVIPIFDILHHSPIRYIQSRHEQGAAHMADAYARSTGKTGVCLATSGPGATNLVTGIATAQMDSVPLVAITGQVRSSLLGNDAFQEVDMTGISRPITKYSRQVKTAAELPRAVREAFHIASTGRPGAVLLDICVDATTTTASEPMNGDIELPGYRPMPTAPKRQLLAAADLINASTRPLLYAGGGVIAAGASDALRQMAREFAIPVTTTLLALGAVDETDALSLGMLGMHGTPAANLAVQDCDCLIAIGARFDDRVTGNTEHFAPRAKIIHVDIDPASIGKILSPDLPITGDAQQVIEQLLPLLQHRDRSAWLTQIAQWKQRYSLRCPASSDGTILPQQVIQEIARQTNHDAIVCTGVGQHQMWTAQLYGFRRPRQLVSSGGLGTMGFGCPAAVGAQLANPGATVIDIDGDGSFSMTMNEVITAVRYRLPAKFFVLDNEYLGMVRQWQQLFWDSRYSGVEQIPMDYAAVARAFGAGGFSCERPEELESAIAQTLAHPGPAVLHVKVAREENVYPMVPAGAGLHEMRLGSLA